MTVENQGGQTGAKKALPKVAVVDDDPHLLAFFKDLADLGHFELVGSYGNAQEALAHLPQCPPDVMFMDVRLPDMSGIECAKRLTTLLPGLRIIVITGHPGESVLIQALMAGAMGFVVKPCTVDETLAAIDDVLDEGVVLSKTALPYLQRIIRQLRHHDPGWNLTEREEQILACIFEGKSDKQISSQLLIGTATVHTHMDHLFEKLGVHSREELIARFLRP